MKFVSWNVNGLRACLSKGFDESVKVLDADALCLQEIKLSEGQSDYVPEGYHAYFNYAQKKGYSGTAIFSKVEPLSVSYGIGAEEYDCEGRTIVAEFPGLYLVNAYVPNAQRELTRLDFRMQWEDRIREFLMALDQKKPVAFCGDLNVAHCEIDLKHPAANRGNAGFTDEERAAMTRLLESGFTDSFRYLHPDERDAYSWWSYMRNARANNAGWRIDYFLISNRLQEKVADARIHADIMGSDHCPVSLVLQ